MGFSLTFRTTAGKTVGFGHLRRCLTLAQEVRAIAPVDAPIGFFISGDPAAVSLTSEAGFQASFVDGPEPDATLAGLDIGAALVADSYDLDENTLSAWHRHVRCLVAIDDLADRFLDVDAVLNVSAHAKRLTYRTAQNCQMWLGPQYALLRPPFRDVPTRDVREVPRRVLVTLGGADPANSTVPIVATVLEAVPGAAIDVVVGPLFGTMTRLTDLAADSGSRVHVHRGLDDLAALMTKADFAISGGGQTLFELAASGLPTIALELADNQRPNIIGLDDVTLIAVGTPTDAADRGSAGILAAACRRLASDPNLRASFSRAGQRLVDGHGAARTARAVLDLWETSKRAPEVPS